MDREVYICTAGVYKKYRSINIFSDIFYQSKIQLVAERHQLKFQH